jgi:hypothetical protein
MPQITLKETITKKIICLQIENHADNYRSQSGYSDIPSDPRHRLIYSFRLDNKHRALFIRPSVDKIEIIAVTKHYRK